MAARSGRPGFARQRWLAGATALPKPARAQSSSVKNFKAIES